MTIGAGGTAVAVDVATAASASRIAAFAIAAFCVLTVWGTEMSALMGAWRVHCKKERLGRMMK